MATIHEIYKHHFAVQNKLDRIARNSRLSFRCKLAAMLASDTRQGKLWN